MGVPKGRYPRPAFPDGRAVTDEEAKQQGFKSAEDWYVQDEAPEGELPKERAVFCADYQLAKSTFFPPVAGGSGARVGGGYSTAKVACARSNAGYAVATKSFDQLSKGISGAEEAV